MTSLSALLSKVDELDKAATPGPWRSDFCGDVFTINKDVPPDYCKVTDLALFRMIGTTTRGPDPGDGAFIASSRTLIPLMAKVIREYQRVLNEIADDNWPNAVPLLDHNDKLNDAGLVEYTMDQAKQAQARVDQLCKEAL